MGPVPFDTSCFYPPINRQIYHDDKSAGKSADLSASGAAALLSTGLILKVAINYRVVQNRQTGDSSFKFALQRRFEVSRKSKEYQKCFRNPDQPGLLYLPKFTPGMTAQRQNNSPRN